MPDFGCRNQVQHTVHHSQAGTEDRHNRHFLSLQLLHCGVTDGCGDLHISQRQAPCGLIADEHGNFTDCLPEILGARFNSPDVPDFVLNQRMIHDYYLCHNICPPVCFYTFTYLPASLRDISASLLSFLFNSLYPSGMLFFP